MKTRTSVMFPCGYVITNTTTTGLFDMMVKVELDDCMKKCPLHGVKCK